MTRILISKSTCPYCEHQFQKTPSRKTKCSSCSKTVYVRTGTNRNQYLITEDEVEKFEQEWATDRENQRNCPNRTEEEYEQLFKMPLRFTINKAQTKGFIGGLFKKKADPVRWVLGSWCKKHCKGIAGYPSCAELEGEYDTWNDLPTVPAGKVACHSDEFLEWWEDHNNEEQEHSWCDCHIEVFRDGKWE